MFECIQCGDCCNPSVSRWGLPKGGTLSRACIWFTAGDINRVADFLGLSVAQFNENYNCEDGMVDVTNSPCPFLTNKNRCSIQTVKPGYCRDWPKNATREQLDDCRGYNVKEL